MSSSVPAWTTFAQANCCAELPAWSGGKPWAAAVHTQTGRRRTSEGRFCQASLGREIPQPTLQRTPVRRSWRTLSPPCPGQAPRGMAPEPVRPAPRRGPRPALVRHRSEARPSGARQDPPHRL